MNMKDKRVWIALAFASLYLLPGLVSMVSGIYQPQYQTPQPQHWPDMVSGSPIEEQLRQEQTNKPLVICITEFATGEEVKYKRIVQATLMYKDADIQKDDWGGYSKGVEIKKVCGFNIFGRIVFVTFNHRDPNNKQYQNFNISYTP